MKSLLSSLLIGATLQFSPVLAQDAAPIDPDAVLAEVNGKEITLGHVIALASRLPAQYAQVEAQILYDGILDQLIQQELLAGTVNLDTRAARLSIENETRTALAAEALAIVSLEATSEEAVISAYEAEVAAYVATPEFRASHILVETEEEAQALVSELEGGAVFADLAREKSTGPSGPNGGDLGWFGPGAMVPPFDEAVQAMDVGGISGPVQTQFGWHVINLVDARDSQPPSLDQRYNAIADQLRNAAVEAYITQLEVDAEITRNDVEFDVEEIRNIENLD